MFVEKILVIAIINSLNFAIQQSSP